MFEKLTNSNELHPLNIYLIEVAPDISKFDILIDFNELQL